MLKLLLIKQRATTYIADIILTFGHDCFDTKAKRLRLQQSKQQQQELLEG